MADKEGRVTMAGKLKMTSLVSSYDDDSDSDLDDRVQDRSAPSATVNSNKQTSTKRPHSQLDSKDHAGEPEQKKFSMAFGLSGSQAKSESGSSASFSLKMSSKSSLTSKKSSSDSIKAASSVKAAPIKLSLANQSKVKESSSTPGVKKSSAVARAFRDDDSDDNEDMPAGARMRMRNIGRETPTAAGPNSFGKGRLGFCDRQKMVERELEKELEKEAA